MPTFAARRSYRPIALYFGLAWLVACAGAAVAIWPWFALAGMGGFLVGAVAASIPQRVSLAVADGTITPSWRPAVRADRVALGTWVLPGIDAAMGVVVHAGGLRIGAEHDGRGYALTGPAARTVHCHVERSELESLLAALGIARGPDGPLVVPLVRNSQSIAGTLRMMLPWLATMAAVTTLGFTMGEAAWIPILAVVAAGITTMMWQGRRVRPAQLELRVDPDALVLARRGGDVVVRTPWNALVVTRKRFDVSSRTGRYSMPLLELRLRDRELRIGAWDTRLAWNGEPERAWRQPHWLVGAAQWPRLVEALRR